MALHLVGVVGDVVVVASVSIQRQWYMMDRVAVEESDTKVAVFVPQERLVVESDINQLLSTKHDSAGNRLFHRITASEHFLAIIYQ